MQFSRGMFVAYRRLDRTICQPEMKINLTGGIRVRPATLFCSLYRTPLTDDGARKLNKVEYSDVHELYTESSAVKTDCAIDLSVLLPNTNI